MQRTIIVACSFLLLSGCASIPEKPVVEVGVIDYPRLEIMIGLSDGSDLIRHIPLSNYDKATCFRPESWEAMRVYLKLLEEYSKRCHIVGGGK